MKKQVVLIMTDTTRRDMLGCYGYPEMKTPNLDRLAREGLRFDRAYTCQPVCGPARSAIFTGLFPHSNGEVANCVPLGANVKTIGERLTDSGLHCGYIGKWHMDGGDYFGTGVCPEGWDKEYWYDMRRYLEELTEADRVRSRSSQTAYSPDMTAGFTYAHRCSDRALSFLDRYCGEDFFLTVSYDEPHGPSLCPAPYNTMYDGFRLRDCPNFYDDLAGKPLMQRLWAGDALKKTADEINRPSRALSLFLGCNSFADSEIGRVLDKLRACAPDAMIIFTSDHGDMLGSHRLQTKNGAAYREIANIPLIIKGGAAGAATDAPASHIDLAPTILDYFGLPVPKLLEGRSMLRQIRDPAEDVNDTVYVEFTRYEVDHDGFGGLQMMRAAVTRRYKLAINLLDTDEFYDIEKDPYEMNNLIGDESRKAERNALHDRLLDHMNRTRDPYRGYQWECRPWRSDKTPRWANDGFTRQRENEEYEPRQLDYDTGLPMAQAVRKKTTADEKA
jgi:arylsulfatase A-like enzyme